MKETLTYEHMGTPVRINLNTPKEYKISRKVYNPLPASRIVGFDTESPTRGEDPHLEYVQVYTPQRSELFELVDLQKEGMQVLLEFLFELYGEHYKADSDVKQRHKVSPENKYTRRSNTSRDGRRQTIQPIVLACFNLEYDLGRLINNLPSFKRPIAFGVDAFTFEYDDYIVEIVYNCLGVACPSFQWIVKHPKTKRVIRIVGFDSSNYFKTTLKKTAAQLQTPTQKMDIDTTMFTRDLDIYPLTNEELVEFRLYSIVDARVHHEVYLAIVELLRDIDIAIIDKKGCIPASAPSAAAKVMQHMCSVDSYLSPPTWVQQMGLDAYKGAISFCSHPGYHSNVDVVDISSAYPHVMMMLPDICTCEYKRIKPQHYQHKKWVGKWGVLVVSGESFDDIYPPLVMYQESKQRGVFGRFEKFTATIPEITMGVARGALRIDAIHDGCEMVGSNDTSGLKRFIETMYHIKNTAPKNSPLYLMAKLLMNSLYGKFIEKRHAFSSLPAVDEFGNHMSVQNIPDVALKAKCKDTYLKYGYLEVDALQSEWIMQHDNTNFEQVSLNDYLSEDSWESGVYFNSMVGAQITGFTRAKLMCGAAYLKAFMGDTDSLFCESVTPVQMDGFIAYLNSVGAITPHDGLGSFEVEAKSCHGLFAKKKVYFLLDGDNQKVKMGHHGFSGIESDGVYDVEQMTIMMIERYYLAKYLRYKTKPRPVRLKQALRTNGIIGKFERKEIVLQLVDNDYQWVDDDGWKHWKECNS